MLDSLGRRILQSRLALAAKRGRPVSQMEIARELGVTGVTVSRWEADKKEPDLATIHRLARFLEVDPGWLAFGEAGATQDADVSYEEVSRTLADLTAAARDFASKIVDWPDGGWRSPAVAERTKELIESLGRLVESTLRPGGHQERARLVASQIRDAYMARLSAPDASLRLSDDVAEIIDFASALMAEARESPLPGLRLSMDDIIAFRRAVAKLRAGLPETPGPIEINTGIPKQLFGELTALRGSREIIEVIADQASKIGERLVLSLIESMSMDEDQRKAELRAAEITFANMLLALLELESPDEVVDYVEQRVFATMEDVERRMALIEKLKDELQVGVVSLRGWSEDENRDAARARAVALNPAHPMRRHAAQDQLIDPARDRKLTRAEEERALRAAEKERAAAAKGRKKKRGGSRG